MPDIKKCPNDETHQLEKLTDNAYYCPQCNVTFKLVDGKVKIEAESKGLITEIQEQLTYQGKDIDDIKKALFGVNKDGESALPFMD